MQVWCSICTWPQTEGRCTNSFPQTAVTFMLELNIQWKNNSILITINRMQIQQNIVFDRENKNISIVTCHMSHCHMSHVHYFDRLKVCCTPNTSFLGHLEVLSLLGGWGGMEYLHIIKPSSDWIGFELKAEARLGKTSKTNKLYFRDIVPKGGGGSRNYGWLSLPLFWIMLV